MSVYKKENPTYLSDSLESILINQTCKPDELILVKDGPLTNELEQVIKRYQSLFTNFKVVPLEKNMGLGLALRKDLEHYNYEWVARMDTDDIAKPNRFEEQLNYFQEHPDLANECIVRGSSPSGSTMHLTSVCAFWISW